MERGQMLRDYLILSPTTPSQEAASLVDTLLRNTGIRNDTISVLKSPIDYIPEPTQTQLYEYWVKGNVGEPGFGQMYPWTNEYNIAFPPIRPQQLLPSGVPLFDWGPSYLVWPK